MGDGARICSPHNVAVINGRGVDQDMFPGTVVLYDMGHLE